MKARVMILAVGMVLFSSGGCRDTETGGNSTDTIPSVTDVAVDTPASDTEPREDTLMFPDGDSMGDSSDVTANQDIRDSALEYDGSMGDVAPPEAACGSLDGRARGEYWQVYGDIDSRLPCNKVCENVCLECDGMYEHPVFGPIGVIIKYGEDAESRSEGGCEERPKNETTDPFSGEKLSLSGYTCYCRPPSGI